VIDEQFKNHVKGLIYPVPDPKYPFLGVHFIKRIDGQMTIGPNAFISFGRENYTGNKFNLTDIYDFLTYKGFWKFSSKNMPGSGTRAENGAQPNQFCRRSSQICAISC
jgi:L-2-hydroxyglutarate oxidase LhgO